MSKHRQHGTAPNRTALIIGYGNPLRGDDAIGQVAADALAAEAAIDGADAFHCHQLTPELAERIATVDLVVFVDAAAGRQPGSVIVTPVRGSLEAMTGLAHHVDPGELLAMS